MIKNRLVKRLLTITALVSCLFAMAKGQQPAGTWEGEIQDPKRPLILNLDFEKLIGSLSGNVAVKTTRPITSGDGATTFEVTVGSQVLRFAGTQRGQRMTGEVDTSSRRIPFWLELLPKLPQPRNRVEAWQQDIDVVTSRFLLYDRSFTEHQRAAVRVHLHNLRQQIDHLSDQAIIVELARAVAMSGNAHTRLYLMRNRTEVRRVPLRVWWFGNELRVVRAANEYTDLTGCSVLRLGRLSALAAFDKVRGIKAGNESWQRYMSAYFLTSPDILYGAGVISDPDHLPLTVKCDRQERQVEVNPLPLRKSTAPVEAWWDMAPGYKDSNIEFKPALPADKAPLYLEHSDRNYWVEYLAPQSIVYVQYNRSEEMSSEPMPDFIRRVTALLDEHQVKGFIVDVRFNTGGDLGVGRPLVEKLAPRLQNVPVVVLTGRATFSAGISHTAQWKQFAHAAIVGEPIGDNIDLWGEGGNLVLPNSGLTVHYANGFHKYSQKDYPAFKPYFAELNVATLQPDLVVEPTWSQYLAGEDPVLQAAIAVIQKTK
jgi:hypothetical protein